MSFLKTFNIVAVSFIASGCAQQNSNNGAQGSTSQNGQTQSGEVIVSQDCGAETVSSEEASACSITNSERQKQGLGPLSWDSRLYRAALDHATDMATRGYFSHVTPEGLGPGARLQKYSVSYRSYGENIAYGYNTGLSAMNGWMNSSGHRANILGDYSAVGIAVYKGYWVQVFIKN